jgi:uncharacterized protein YecE (DUF72 family)
MSGAICLAMERMAPVCYACVMTRSTDSNTTGSAGSNMVWLGTAGWNVPVACRERVGGQGSHLERYSRMLNATEINSSFYRPHRRTTYERWALATPDQFRFSVKVPKSVTHVAGLALPELRQFIGETAGLGEKLAVLLIQFPPTRRFNKDEAQALFEALRALSPATLVCEPRHASWFAPDVDHWFNERRIGRVVADPAPTEGAERPGGWQGIRYFRLHGSPRIYYSKYADDALCDIRRRLVTYKGTAENWCIFDNTALGAAMENALALQGM